MGFASSLCFRPTLLLSRQIGVSAAQESRGCSSRWGVFRGELRSSPRGLIGIPDAVTEPSREAKAE